MPITLFPMRLLQVHLVAPGVKQFLLGFEKGDQHFQYQPGQFITLHLKDQEHVYKRSYSIVNPPEQPTQMIQFAASYVKGGIASQFLFHLNVGQILNVSGPYGRLILKQPYPKRYIFIGTGTGIAPYCAMLPQLSMMIQQYPALKVVILQGVRTQQDALYVKLFQDFVSQHGGAQFQLCLSRALEADMKQDVYLGRIQTRLPELLLDPAQDMIYLCGNPEMIDETLSLLLKQGFTIQQIVREKYISN